MKEYTAGRNEAGQRLDKFLFKILPEAGRSFLCKMMRKKNITLNGGKCEGNERLSEGDVVRIWFSDETLEKFSGMKAGSAGKETLAAPDSAGKDPLRDLILFEGEEVLLFSKPRGMLSQKAAPGDVSANEHLIRHLLINGSLTEAQLRTFRPAVVNRLDRNTTGLIIFGKTAESLRQLTKLIRLRDYVAKYYIKPVQKKVILGDLGRSDISMTCVTLQGGTVLPAAEKNDLHVCSVGNTPEYNKILRKNCVRLFCVVNALLGLVCVVAYVIR